MAKMVVMVQQSVLILGVLELLSEASPTVVKQMVPNAVRKMI